MNGSEHCSQDKMRYLDQEYGLFAQQLIQYGEGREDGDFAHPVFGCGNITSDIMLIGEAPGKEEAALGAPFVGKAGKTLTYLLDLIDIDRENIYISNVVKFRPYTRTNHGYKNRTPNKKEIEKGLELLSKEIETVNPRVIVTLGNTPLYAVCRILGLKFETIGTMHGKLYSAEPGRIQLFPAYHPASCIYNRALEPVLEEDMMKLRTILKTTESGF